MVANRPGAVGGNRSIPALVRVVALASCCAAAAHTAPLSAQTGAIRGVVLSNAGEPVGQPLVTLPQLGRVVVGDSLGRFELTAVAVGTWRLDVRRIGYREVSLRLAVAAGETTRVEVRMSDAPVELAPINTAAREPARERFEDEAVTSFHSLTVREIARVPSLGERDALRAVQLMPGVVARNDYSVTLNVRGGDADQNLVLLDGQVVFNPFHLGGLLSTFADDAIDGIDFMAGGFPAAYGGRLSSVLDVSQRNGRTDRVGGTASVSLVAARLHLEGPLPGGRGSWLVAGRRTYADQIVDALSSETFPYHFQDLLARIALPLGGGALSFSAFASGDYFDFELTPANSGQSAQRFVFDWGNGVAGLTWRRSLGQRTSFVQRAGTSSFFADIAVGPGLLSFENRVRRWALAGDIEHRTGDHSLGAGYLLERHAISYGVGSGDLGLDVARLRYRPAALEVYAEDQWRPEPWLLVRPGARLTHLPGSDFTRLAPRLALKAFTGERTALTAAAGRYYQYIHSLRDEEIPISLFEFWIGSDRDVPVGSADHAVLGLERWLDDATSVTVEGWWKEMRGLVDQDEADDPAVRGDEFSTARGHARGADFLVRRTQGAVTGWITWSVARVWRRLETGESYTPAQDRRHSVNAIVSFAGPLGARWTARWGYGSPLPYTGIAGQWVHRFYDPGRNLFTGAFTEPYRSERNALRYPAYSRLDVSARWEFGWLGARWSPHASLLNSYARTNVFVYFFDYTSAPPLRRGLSQFPFLPAVGLDVSF
jgi:hypothetical protein